MKKRILLIGGFNKTMSLADSLIKKGYAITVINEDADRCRQFARIKGINVICGDGSKPYVLEEAGADTADISIALTSDDASNLIASELCKKKFNVNKTVALAGDPGKTEFFHRMGVDSVVCAVNAVTAIIEQSAIVDEITKSIPIGDGRVGVTEVVINEKSPVLDKKLWEISFPKEVIVGCILRGDLTIIPRGDTRILSGDILVVIASANMENEAVTLLTGK